MGRSERPEVVLDIASAADVLAEIIVAENLGRRRWWPTRSVVSSSSNWLTGDQILLGRSF